MVKNNKGCKYRETACQKMIFVVILESFQDEYERHSRWLEQYKENALISFHTLTLYSLKLLGKKSKHVD